MPEFPHLRVGTFIEAGLSLPGVLSTLKFPHLRVGTFIEAPRDERQAALYNDFPTFGWGLSLRPSLHSSVTQLVTISPPSGGDFH